VGGCTHCHRPIIVAYSLIPRGGIIADLREGMEVQSDAVMDRDIVLLWTQTEKRVITGADLLGRLLRGINTTI